MTLSIRRATALVATLGIGVVGATACGANDTGGGGSEEGGSEGGATIALLLPESKTTRYEAFDKPLFEAKVAELCQECDVLYLNADQDPAKQQQQFETALTDGAEAIVLDPVDGEAASGLLPDAQAEEVPVIAYDRFIDGADYYMSFDNETVGRLQAESLVEALGDQGGYLMLNGAPTDPNAAQFKKGATEVLEASNLELLTPKPYDNPDWSPENAQSYVSDQLGQFSPDEIDGVYAANDGQAGGVIAALTGAGIAPDALPPVTGQDAELAAIQRIVTGEQHMTIYKSIKTEAEKAAEVAVALVNGDEVTDTVDFEGVPSFIFEPVVVTQDNIMDTVVADEFWSVEEICTADYADACSQAGLS